MRIEQARVSHGLRRFKKGIMDRWGLKDYHDKNAPCFFFNLNGKDDIEAVKSHRGFKLVMFANARGNSFVGHLIGVDDLVVIDNEYLDCPKEIKSKDCGTFCPFEIKDYSMFKPNVLGDKIYCYIGNDAQKHKYGYERAVGLKTGYDILFGKQEHTIEDLKKNFYDKCFVNLNFEVSGGGGTTTLRELALMGRKTIMNTRLNYPVLSYKDDDDVVRIINEEAKKIGTIQEGEDYHTVGAEWQHVGFWKNLTIDINRLLCNEANFLKELGYGGHPMIYFPFTIACVEYFHGDKEKAMGIYVDFIKKLFRLYGHKTTKEGGIVGLWWVTRIKESGLPIDEAIMEHAKGRFALADSMAKGYDPYRKEILVSNRDGKYYLSDGHHRVCILYALGYKNVENIRIK